MHFLHGKDWRDKERVLGDPGLSDMAHCTLNVNRCIFSDGGVKEGKKQGHESQVDLLPSPAEPQAHSFKGTGQSLSFGILGGLTEIPHTQCLVECPAYAWLAFGKLRFFLLFFLLQSEVQGMEWNRQR